MQSFGPEVPIESCYVSRTYVTRHGAGELAGECGRHELNPGIVDVTNTYNPFQGSLRYGHMGMQKLAERIASQPKVREEAVNESVSIALTHVNEYPVAIPHSGIFRYMSDNEAVVWEV